VTPWKVILATMVIFACGVITGAMVTRTMVAKNEPALVAVSTPILTTNPASTSVPGVASTSTRPPATPLLQLQRANFLKLMDKQLDLTADQRDEIGKIMKASTERTQPLWNQISPQMTNEIKKVREEIRAVLTPEQRKKFVEMMKRNRKPEVAPPGNGRPPRSTPFATNASE